MTESLSIAVREATSADSVVLADLYEIGRKGIEAERGAEIDSLLHERTGDLVTGFTEDLHDRDVHILVGLVDSVLVGYVVVRIVEPRAGTKLAIVNDLFVLPEARGVGVGRALLDVVVEISQSAGCIGLSARALPGDRATKNFFESFGLVARSIDVHVDLR